MEKINSFTFVQNCKLKIASSLYRLNLFIEKIQFQNNASKIKTNTLPSKTDSTKIKFYTYKTTSWSTLIPGINISTPKYLPTKHFTGIGYALRTLIAFVLLRLSYTFKGTFTKEKLLNLNNLKSPFFSFDNNNIWISDKDFALRTLQGPSPQTIRKIRKYDWILSKISDDLLIELTGINDLDLIYTELYIVDYSIFEGLKTKNNFQIGAPQALFFQDSNKEILIPIAISITKEDNNLYTPLDSTEAWTYAKLSFLQNEVLYMPLINHVVESHLWMDPVIISTDFYLPKQHPVYNLVYPHLKGNFAINKLAYLLLLKPKAFFDQFSQYSNSEICKLLKKGLEEFTINKKILPKDIELRGVENIKYYPYRDDALMIWEALSSYVENYLNLFYTTENEISKDEYLIKWKINIKHELNINSDVSLPILLTTILFNIYDHNIHQNSLVEYYTNPFIATPLLGNLPQNKNEITEAFLFKSHEDIKSKIGFGFLIKIISAQTEVFSAEKFDSLLLNKPAEDLKECFLNIEKTIVCRNTNRIRPYTSALPSKIDNSIKI